MVEINILENIFSAEPRRIILLYKNILDRTEQHRKVILRQKYTKIILNLLKILKFFIFSSKRQTDTRQDLKWNKKIYNLYVTMSVYGFIQNKINFAFNLKSFENTNQSIKILIIFPWSFSVYSMDSFERASNHFHFLMLIIFSLAPEIHTSRSNSLTPLKVCYRFLFMQKEGSHQSWSFLVVVVRLQVEIEIHLVLLTWEKL